MIAFRISFIFLLTVLCADLVVGVPENPGEAAAYYHSKGLEFFNEGDMQQAIEMWKKEIEINPKSGWAYYDIGLSYTNLKQYDEGVKWHKKAVEVEPGRGRFHFGVGFTLAYRIWENYDREDRSPVIRTDLESAIQYFKKAITLGEINAGVYAWLTECYYRLGRYQEAEKNLIEALKIDPNNQYGMLDRFPNITEDMINKFQEEYQKREEEKKKRREVRMKQLQKEGRFKEIEIPADVLLFMYFPYFVFGVLLIAGLIALRTKPWWRYHVYVGDKHFSRNDYSRALKHYEKLLNFNGGKFAPYEKLKTIYLTMRRTDSKAVLVYEKLYEENPEDKELILALADIYAESGSSNMNPDSFPVKG